MLLKSTYVWTKLTGPASPIDALSKRACNKQFVPIIIKYANSTAYYNEALMCEATAALPTV